MGVAAVADLSTAMSLFHCCWEVGDVVKTDTTPCCVYAVALNTGVPHTAASHAPRRPLLPSNATTLPLTHPPTR
ncbi:hypothetical protein E2C01_003244 [Portunus trituberculatus]|uniref:Uncharacterized protein n=1 Tax=Portunus trituberculatus TaxID=210409 RepID=A0A5B7CLW2_PORTR|nr:hypothetical protein [Portunus trituberculatus]